MYCDLNDFMTKDKVTNKLEPRLMEYLRKRRAYKQNNIDIHFLEKEFDINDYDLKTIRTYLKGGGVKKNNRDMIDPTQTKLPFGDMYDPRWERLKKKQKLLNDAKVQRNNYDTISRGYDMYRSDRAFASAYGDDFRKDDFKPNEWFDENSTFNNPNIAHVNRNNNSGLHSTNLYNSNKQMKQNYVHPKSNYNNYAFNETIYDDPNSLDSIMKNLDKHNKQYSRPYKSNNNMFNNEIINDNDFNTHFNNNVDTNVDNFLKFGSSGKTPGRNNKAIGYPNPFEHYFSYISDDIQDPAHVVNFRGMPTRMLNHETARSNNKTRDIMP